MHAVVIFFLLMALIQHTFAGAMDLKGFRENSLDGVDCIERGDPCESSTKALRRKVYPAVLEQDSKYAGHLQSIRVLGKGSFGDVFLKMNVKTGDLYAVKFLKSHINGFEVPADLLMNEYECQYMCRRKPNVVQAKELVYSEKQKSRYMLIMEYCGNGTLADFVLKNKDVNGTSYLKPYFRQLISGLAQIHSSGVAHRDIKPSNILIDCQGIFKYSDFGLSLDVTDSCMMNCNLDGTAVFVAPEAHNKASCKFDLLKADVWALGITLYSMVSGKYPFKNSVDDPKYLMFKNSSDSLLGLSGNRTAEFELISKMLTINPENRPSAIELLRDPYFNELNTRFKWSNMKLKWPGKGFQCLKDFFHF